MAERTSVTDPIYVDFVGGLRGQAGAAGGRLGLTLAPGKVQAHPMTGRPWRRDVQTDVRDLVEKWGAHVLVSLMTRREFDVLQNASIFEVAPAAGLEHILFSIPDGCIPRTDAEGLRNFTAFVGNVVGMLEHGRCVVVHCMGGLGRSGLVAACVAVAADPAHDVDAAIAAVRSGRPGALKPRAQVEFVREFAAALSLQ